MRRARSILVTLFGSSVGVLAVAQPPAAPDRVQWTASFAARGTEPVGGGVAASSAGTTGGDVTAGSAGTTGGNVTTGIPVVLEISGAIQDGWHVYALTEPSGGPTPLRVTLDQNDLAQAAGAPSGTSPHKHHDPSFGLETQFYTHAFTVRLPVVLKSIEGRQLVPVSVRFQTCSDRECQPPTTAHLSVPVDVRPSAS